MDRVTFLGKTKEVFDAELFAFVQATKPLESRGETGRDCTVSSDSETTLRRIRSDEHDPGQRYATEATEEAKRLLHSSRIALRWTPAHQGAEGDKIDVHHHNGTDVDCCIIKASEHTCPGRRGDGVGGVGRLCDLR